LADVARTGRNGRGAVVLGATGNESRAQVGYPASDVNCIGVGASTDADELAAYSNRGRQVWVVAPSSGGSKGIFATDVAVTGRGFNVGGAATGGVDGLFTNDFGGTSSATPLVAGLVALMLSVNPKLTPAQVRQHLAASARKIGPAASYNAQGHSVRYGHGCIDAHQALKAVKQAMA
jgi:subtilisin family serine protease